MIQYLPKRPVISLMVLLVAGIGMVPSSPLVSPANAVEGADAAKLAVESRLLAEAAANIEKHRKAAATIRVRDAEGRPVPNARLEIRQTGHEFLFGCIIFDLVRAREPYQPDLFKRRFKELFNFAVFPFYWKPYEPQLGSPRRAEAVEVARWCRENGITTKGHPLVWTHPAGVPGWLKGKSMDESEKLLLGRVTRDVKDFTGLVDIWDVVNEPVHTRTWRNVAGKDYIAEPIDRIADYVEKAFRTAHAANPKANLILNEYNTIARPQDRERFVRLVQELKRRGTPISGLGIQAHEPRQHWYPPHEVWATYDRFAGLGYPLHVTEFIPQSGGKEITGGWRTGKWTETTQAEFAEQFLRLSFGHPAMVSFNWWGLSDRQIWLPGGGLIDREYQPKPVYTRLKKLIHEEWTTHVDATTDEQGTAAFRGFRGRYTIRVKPADGEARSFEATLSKDMKNNWEFTL